MSRPPSLRGIATSTSGESLAPAHSRRCRASRGRHVARIVDSALPGSDASGVGRTSQSDRRAIVASKLACRMLKRWRGVARTGILAVVGLALAAQPALGDVICKKRRGAMFIRAACRRKELQIRLADFGALGPPGDSGAAGAAGTAGTARGHAQVNSYQFHFGMVVAMNVTSVFLPEHRL